MHTVISRLILQLTLGAAFGAGQLIFAMAASHVPVASVGTLIQPPAPATIATPAGFGWG